MPVLVFGIDVSGFDGNGDMDVRKTWHRQRSLLRVGHYEPPHPRVPELYHSHLSSFFVTFVW